MRRPLGAGLLGFVLLACPSARAQAEPVALEWQAPEACPDQATLERAITALLGHGLESPEGVEHVRGVIEPKGRGFVLELHFRGGPGDPRRRLEDRSCNLLADAAALIVALALDPTAVAETAAEPLVPIATASSSEPAPFSPFTSDLPPRRPGPPPPPAGAADELSAPGIPFSIPYPRFLVRGMLGGDAGIGPVGYSIQIGGGIVWSRLRFELLLSRFLPRSDGRGDVALWTAGGRSCVDPLALEIEMPICLGVEAGLFEVEPNNGVVTRGPWIAPVLAGSLAYRGADPLILIGTLEGYIPLLRPAGPAGDRGAVVAARALVGAELRFP